MIRRQVPAENANAELPRESSGWSTDPATGSPLELVVDAGRIKRLLLQVIGFLVLAGIVANVTMYHIAPSPDHALARVMKRLDLGHEPSIPNWYSSMALVTCSVLLSVIAVAKRRQRQPFIGHWFGLAVLFFLMGLDEAVMIHEMVDTAIRGRFHTSGVFYFAWVIPGAMLVLVVGLAYLKFLGHLDARTRWLFILSGGVFVAGAIGMEMVAGIIFTVSTGVESLAHTASQAVEEGFEMLGIVLFIYALLEFIGREVGPIVLRVVPAGAIALARPTASPTEVDRVAGDETPRIGGHLDATRVPNVL